MRAHDFWQTRLLPPEGRALALRAADPADQRRGRRSGRRCRRCLLLDDRLERRRQRPKFIGLDNFRHLFFDDPSFWHAFRTTCIWLAMFLTVPIAMALIAASLLAPIRRGAIFFRMALFIPYVLPSVVVAASGAA